jgi:hypothetical protein
MGGGMSYRVLSLLYADGALYAGGSFVSADNNVVNNIAKWSGSEWRPLDNGLNGDVYALAYHDGKLFASGKFDSTGYTDAHGIAYWDGYRWYEIGDGIDSNDLYNYPVALQVSPDEGVLYVGGYFQTAGGKSSANLASLTLFEASLPPTLDIRSALGNTILSWPASGSNGFVLQQSGSLISPNWAEVLTTPSVNGNRLEVSTPNNLDKNFFRLYKE